MTGDGNQMDAPDAIRLGIVAAGNGWWVNTGPGASSIATYVFVDVEEHPELLELPTHAADADWSAYAGWLDDGSLLRIEIGGPLAVKIELAIDRPELEAVRHARTLYVCPTTPQLGLSPYRARDHSFVVRLPRRP